MDTATTKRGRKPIGEQRASVKLNVWVEPDLAARAREAARARGGMSTWLRGLIAAGLRGDRPGGPDTVAVPLTPEQLDRLDARRGTTPRATWLARLIAAALGK